MRVIRAPIRKFVSSDKRSTNFWDHQAKAERICSVKSTFIEIFCFQFLPNFMKLTKTTD